MRRVLLLLSLMLIAPHLALGMSFTTPLDDLTGVIDFTPSQGGRGASFDFGTQFSSIESVSIEVEAHVFARQFDVCGTIFDPQSCTHEVQLLGFLAQLDTEGHPVFSVQSSGGLTYGDFTDLEGYGTDAASFDDQFIQSDFDYLLDGEGSLILYWNSALGDPDRFIQNLVEPSGEIIAARLIIEGTPIPEPSTALLFGTGLLILVGTKRP